MLLLCVASTQMVQMFSPRVLGSVDEMDLDELLATKLVTFMMEHHGTIFQVPSKLRRQVDEHLSHLKRVQVSTFFLPLLGVNGWKCLCVLFWLFSLENLYFSLCYFQGRSIMQVIAKNIPKKH